jgi:hypothetical protein
MTDGQTTTTTGLEGLSLGERIVRVARMAVEAHLAQSSAATFVPDEPETRRQIVIGGAGGRLIPIDPADRDLSSRVRHG